MCLLKPPLNFNGRAREQHGSTLGAILEGVAGNSHRRLFSSPTQLPTADYTDGGLMTHRGAKPPSRVLPAAAAAAAAADRAHRGDAPSYRGDVAMGSARAPDDDCRTGVDAPAPTADLFRSQPQPSGVVRGDFPLAGVVETPESEEEQEEEQAGSSSHGSEGGGAGGGDQAGGAEAEAESAEAPKTPRAGGSGGGGGGGGVRERLAGLVAGMTPTAQRVVSSARVTAAQVRSPAHIRHTHSPPPSGYGSG
jgi:hypothetical protein